MLYEEGISVRGEIKTIWQNLLNALTAYRYQLDQQVPYSHISAKRGSKVVSFMLEGTKGGYRELHIQISPTGKEPKEFAVQFRFSFPNWAMTLPGTKKECSALIEEFARMTGGETGALESRICGECKASNPADASFCQECGAKLASGTSFKRATTPEALTCPQCTASIPTGSKFCPTCGTKL